MSLKRFYDVGSSVLASSLAGWRGSAKIRAAQRLPAQPLELYEYEAHPECRRLREALTEFDLDVMVFPCPEGGTRFRLRAQVTGGTLEFPFLIDPNTGTRVHGAAEAIAHLVRSYAARPARRKPLRAQLAAVGARSANLARPGRGRRARPSRAPQRPLELYSFESSPYSRLVREVLCELELPYLLRNTGKARSTDLGPPIVRDRLFKAPKDTSRNRAALLRRAGQVQLPYLIDPNTGTEMFESGRIVAYLEATYAA